MDRFQLKRSIENYPLKFAWWTTLYIWLVSISPGRYSLEKLRVQQETLAAIKPNWWKLWAGHHSINVGIITQKVRWRHRGKNYLNYEKDY